MWKCLVWEKRLGSLARSGGTSGAAGPVEMVGAGVCWPGELCQDEAPGGEQGCVCSRPEVAPITDGSFLFFFQMSPGTECLGRTFPGKLGK